MNENLVAGGDLDSNIFTLEHIAIVDSALSEYGFDRGPTEFSAVKWSLVDRVNLYQDGDIIHSPLLHFVC